MRVDVPAHDSDSIIPPKEPHSFVPFSHAPSSMSASSPARSNFSAGPAGSYGRNGQPASPSSGQRESGSRGSAGLGQQGASSTENYSLPAMPWKDWELNLDALEVRMHCLSLPCLPAPRCCEVKSGSCLVGF